VFSYLRPDPPLFAAGGDGWLESTPPVLAPCQALAGLEITLELGVERLRAHNLAQKRLLKSLLPEARGEGEDHGAFLTLLHPDAPRLSHALAQKGVKTDARGEYLRFCPDYLNSRDELERAAAISAALVQACTAR
jgi:kynureninase